MDLRGKERNANTARYLLCTAMPEDIWNHTRFDAARGHSCVTLSSSRDSQILQRTEKHGANELADCLFQPP